MANRSASGRFRFAPNPAFGETLRQLGVRDAEEVTTHDLKNLAFYGMSAERVREFLSLTHGRLTKEELLGLAIREVTPAYARTMQDLGVKDADNATALAELRFLGITTEFVRALRDAGERDLTASRVIQLRRGNRR